MGKALQNQKLGADKRRDRMKKAVYVILSILIIFSCGTVKQEVERIYEDGVEVISNNIEPYETEGKSSNLILEEEFTIDSEREEVAEIGLTDISGFDADCEGNIYIVNFENKESFIFRFDKYGNL